MTLYEINSYSVHTVVYTETESKDDLSPSVVVEVLVSPEGKELTYQKLSTQFSVGDALNAETTCKLSMLGARVGVNFAQTLTNSNQLAAIQTSLINAAKVLDRVLVYRKDQYLSGYKVVGFETGVMWLLNRGTTATLSAIVERCSDGSFRKYELPTEVAKAISNREYVNVAPLIVEAMKVMGTISDGSVTIELDASAKEKLAFVSNYLQSGALQ